MARTVFKNLLKRSTGIALVGVTLGACSQVPDAVNPVEWYNSTVNFFSGDDEQAQKAKTGEDANASQSGLAKNAQPDADQKFPTLSRVDRQAEYEAARKQGGLVADVQGRQYAPAIARQGEPASRLASAPPPAPSSETAAAPAGANAAQPTTPVISSTGVAAAPSVLSSSGGLPTTAEQQAFEARLRQQLAEIRARAGQPGPALAPSNAAAIATMAPDQFGTVVISADGIEAGTQTAALATQPGYTTQTTASGQGGTLSYLARQASPVAPGAVRVATIQFSNGSSQLSAGDRSILAEVRQLQRERGGKVHIVGHASSRTRTMDPVRHKMVNFNVSMARANVIARELIRLGFTKEQLVVDALSDTSPLYFEFMPTGEAANRRAEIYLEG